MVAPDAPGARYGAVTRLPRLDFFALVRVLPLTLLASILLHAIAPASATPAALGSTFRADTANVCVAAASGAQLAQLPVKRTPGPVPAPEPLACGLPVAAIVPAAQEPPAAIAPIPAAAPSHRYGAAAPRAPPLR